MGFFDSLFKPVQNLINPDDEEKKKRKQFQDSVSRLFGTVASDVGQVAGNVGKFVSNTATDITNVGNPLYLSNRTKGLSPDEARKKAMAEQQSFYDKNQPIIKSKSPVEKAKDIGLSANDAVKTTANFYTEPVIAATRFTVNKVRPGTIGDVNLPYLGKQRSYSEQFQENKLGQTGLLGNTLGVGLTALNQLPALEAGAAGLKAIPKTEISKVIDEINTANKEAMTATKGEQGFARIPGKTPKVPSSTSVPPTKPPGVPTTTKLPIETGRLNVNNLDLATPQKQLIQNLEKANLDPMEKITNQQLLDAAKKAGYNMKTHTAESIRAEVGPEINLKRSIVEDTNNHQALIDAGASLEERVQNVPTLIEKIQASTSQGTRASTLLRAKGILADEMQTPMERILRIMDEAKVNWKDPELIKAIANTDFTDAKQVLTLYRSYVKPSFWDWIDLIRYNSMLTSPKTQIVNIASNLESGFVAPTQKTIEGGTDWLATAFSKVNPLMETRARTRFAGEGAAYLKGYWSNVGAGIKKIFSPFKTGDMYPDTGGKFNIPLTSAEDPFVARAGEATLRAPMNLMEGMDQFFTAAGTGGEKGALNYRVSKGVEVTNLEEKAKAAATYSVFRADLGSKSQGPILHAIDVGANTLYHFRNSDNPVVSTIAKYTFPFIRTGTNLMKQGLEYSPGGLLTIPGASDKIAQASKAFMGAGITAGLLMLVDSKRLTFSVPTDPKKADAFKAAHLQPYSIKIGNYWISYSKLHPALSFNLALVAALKTSFDDKKLNATNLETFAASMVKSVQFWADQSYFKSVGDLVGSAQGDTTSISKLFANYPSQLVPFRALLSYVNQLIDPYQREIDKNGDLLTKQLQAIWIQMPVFSNLVPTRKGASGEPIKSDTSFSSDTGLINAVSPARVTKEAPGPLEFYNQLQKSSQINSISKSFDNEINKELDKQMAPYLKELQNTPDYNSLSEKDKAGVISDIQSKLKVGIKYDIYSQNTTTIADNIQKDLQSAKSTSDKINIILTYKSTRMLTDSVLAELEKRGVDLNF